MIRFDLLRINFVSDSSRLIRGRIKERFTIDFNYRRAKINNNCFHRLKKSSSDGLGGVGMERYKSGNHGDWARYTRVRGGYN